MAQPLRPDAGAGRAQKDEIVWPPTVILENVLCRPSGSDFSKRDIYGETMPCVQPCVDIASRPRELSVVRSIPGNMPEG